MFRLAIDASDKIVTLSLRKSSQGEIDFLATALGHVEAFPQLLRDFLLKHGLKASDLTSLSLIQGPGTYTGLRGSLLLAASLAHYAKVPVMLRQRQEVLLYAAQSHKQDFLTTQNVRQNQYHVSIGRYSEGKLTYVFAPAIISSTELITLQAKHNYPVIGDWPEEEKQPDKKIKTPDIASVLCEWSEKDFHQTEVDKLQPYYTRPAVNLPGVHAKAE